MASISLSLISAHWLVCSLWESHTAECSGWEESRLVDGELLGWYRTPRSLEFRSKHPPLTPSTMG
jgi:hypothetical protein